MRAYLVGHRRAFLKTAVGSAGALAIPSLALAAPPPPPLVGGPPANLRVAVTGLGDFILPFDGARWQVKLPNSATLHASVATSWKRQAHIIVFFTLPIIPVYQWAGIGGLDPATWNVVCTNPDYPGSATVRV